MSDHSAIQWTEATWNPTYGCTKVSPGCAHCYIERTPPFRIAGRKFVNGAIDIELHQHRLDEPLHWRKPRRVFVNSLSDLFHEDVPDAFIDRVFAVMALTPQHTFQVLTKRPQRMRAYLTESTDEDGRSARMRVGLEGLGMCLDHYPAKKLGKGCRLRGEEGHVGEVLNWPLSNVWLGVSVENQRFANERIPLLLQTPAAVRFISAEPLLGPVQLTGISSSPACFNALLCGRYPALDWVIVGGESGPGARQCDVAWVRSILRQCQAAGVPVFVKQLGARAYGPDVHSAILRDKKGGDPAEWPADLRVREYPGVPA